MDRFARLDLPRSRLALLLAVTGLALGGCGSDPQTPSCPEMPLYDIRDDASRNDPDVLAAQEEAAENGCATLPGDPVLEGEE